MNLWQRMRDALATSAKNVRNAWATKGQIRSWLRWLAEPAAIVALVLVSRTALAQPFYVPTASMEPTLQIGDALIATMYPYGYSRYSLPFGFGPASEHRLFGKLPARGDVVVFRLPRDPSQIYIKRVIGLPGDRIQMQAGRLIINGKMLPRRAAGSGEVETEDGTRMAARQFIETLPGGREHPIYKLPWGSNLDDTAVFTVPARHLFMMGDDRDDSLDSRVAAADGGVGFVPVENLIGRADVLVGSYDFVRPASPWNWASRFRLSRFFSRLD
jgi:signal peptidase I